MSAPQIRCQLPHFRRQLLKSAVNSHTLCGQLHKSTVISTLPPTTPTLPSSTPQIRRQLLHSMPSTPQVHRHFHISAVNSNTLCRQLLHSMPSTPQVHHHFRISADNAHTSAVNFHILCRQLHKSTVTSTLSPLIPTLPMSAPQFRRQLPHFMPSISTRKEEINLWSKLTSSIF